MTRRLYFDQYEPRKVIEGRSVVHDQYVRIYFGLLTAYELSKFLDLVDYVYKEGVCLFYANMSIPEVPEVSDLIIRSIVLNEPIEFNLSIICDILELPEEGEH